ncbi:MAG TPA: hypothetical protein VGB70_12905 [Allosphingosinicella sp.]|jgi:hypothetical protein
MTGPLTFDFPMMSPLSQRPPFAVPAGEYLLELDEELAVRARSYPVFIEQRRMTGREAERHVLLLQAIRADIAGAAPPGGHPLPFEAKVRELRRELAIRRNAWPGQVEARRMDGTQAARRMERLEAVHWRYWIDMFTADDVFNGVTDREERTAMIRAWMWAREDWQRRAADAGDRAARLEWSTAAQQAAEAEAFAKDPTARAYNQYLDALYLAAARRFGFAPQEGIAA